MVVIMMIWACVLDIKHSGGGHTAFLRVALSLFFLSLNVLLNGCDGPTNREQAIMTLA
jgi:hypothetical protein